MSYSTSDKAFFPISSPRLRQTSSFRHYLPRFIRAKGSHRPPLALQDRDLELLRAAAEYRLITTPQYLLLFPGESRDGIYRRLQKLFHHGHLDRIGNNPNAPLTYALGGRGAEVLEVPVRRDVRDRYIAHRLMVGNFRIALTLATTERGIHLSWKRVAGGLPVKPDGFFGLQFPDLPEGRNRAFFFLEADRSTMTWERFLRKLLGYWEWFGQGGHSRKLGIRAFRVLTVTTSEQRMASLLQAAAKAEGLQAALPLFWFTSEKRLTPTHPGSIFAPVWESSDRVGTRRSILP